ncbi:hypothetical protein [Elongatibacter sediminis]|uniref:Uncharacterized protein n=1 Tax=Elongatibacter sediminis TaxID=3119006 RepID=A0AAW9RJH5_9GAMM
MNRKNLTAAVLAGLAGAAGIASSAQAVNLNPDGLGQVLIYPYYTSNDGNDTLLSVVNTTDSAKAVKVRFLEGYNSREVLDFNMYMSAWDVWVAAIVDGGSVDASQAGVPHLIIPDTTCTVPYLYGDGIDAGLDFGLQEFLPYAYTGDYEDGGPTDIARASEGHFEVIEMGTLTNETETAKRLGSADAATHIFEDGKQVPADCMQLVDNWTDFASGDDGMWLDDETLDIARNSGGLFGGAAVVNVGKGTMHAYNARAIQGYDKDSDGNHFRPGNERPSLNDGDQRTATVFFGVPQDRAVQLSYLRGVDAISATFMHEYIMNEYNIEAGLNAASEWIVTFPTKNFYVDPMVTDLQSSEWQPKLDDPGCGGWIPGEPFPSRNGPFDGDSVDQDDENSNGVPDVQEDWVLCTYEEVFTVAGREPFTSVFDGEACEAFGLEIWDREENAGPDTPGNDRPPIVSPAPPGGSTPPEAPFELCYEVNVLRFGDGPVFGTTSDLLYTIGNAADNGWARINFGADPDHVDWAGLVGLPVTGFWAVQYENGFLGTPEASVLANYGGLFDHRANTRRSYPSRSID